MRYFVNITVANSGSLMGAGVSEHYVSANELLGIIERFVDLSSPAKARAICRINRKAS
jgi:hypothetical protein